MGGEYKNIETLNEILFNEISTPSAPATDKAILYAFDDSGTTRLGFQDSGGTQQTMLNAEDKVFATVSSTGQYSTLKAAVDAGEQSIAVLGNTTETANISFSDDTTIYIASASIINMGANKFIMGGASIRIAFFGEGEIEWAHTSTNTLFDASLSLGTVLFLSNIQLDNKSTANNCNLANNIRLKIQNVRYTVPDQTNCGLNIVDNGSMVQDITFVGGGTSCQEVLAMSDGMVKGIQFTESFSITKDIITCPGNASISDVNFDTLGTSFSSISGVCNNLYSTASKNINIKICNNDTLFTNADLGGGSLDLDDKDFCKISNVVANDINLTDSGANNNMLVNCRTRNVLTITGDRNKISNGDFAGGITVNGNDNGIVNCQAGADSGTGLATITVNLGANRTRIVACMTANAISDSGSGTVTAANTVY